MAGDDVPVLPPIQIAGPSFISRAHYPSNLRKSLSVDSFTNHSRASITSFSSASVTRSTVIEDQEEAVNGTLSASHWRTELDLSLSSSFDRPPARAGTRDSSISVADGKPSNLSSGATSSQRRYTTNESTFVRTDQSRERLQSVHSLDDVPSPSSSSSSSPTPPGFSRLPFSLFQDLPYGAQPGPSQVASQSSVSSRSHTSSQSGGNPNCGIPMSINTQLSNSPHSLPVTIAVVGAIGSGKSTAIFKGCKPYSISKPTLEKTESLNYTSRFGKLSQDATRVLRVIEMDSDDLKLTNSASSVWPDSAPRIDGVVVCYDASDETTFTHVEKLIHGYQRMMLPTVVLACKSDLNRAVDSQVAAKMLNGYHVGLIEVTAQDKSGKEKMRRCFDWMIQSVYRERSSNRQNQSAGYRNPASPDILVSSTPWEDPRTSNNTPTPGPSQQRYSRSRSSQTSLHSFAPPRSPSAPSSPTRARPTSDLLLERHRSTSIDTEERGISVDSSRNTTDFGSRVSLPPVGPGDSLDDFESRSKIIRQDQRLTPWAIVDELLDKLIFSVVTDDDHNYVSNFLLTYRRFTSPRIVLLTMQKRMRQLDHQASDPMFACLAQMSLCRLLADWVRDYPHDFAVRGTAGALSALVKSIITKTHLIHYGLEFLPFLDVLPNLVDQDAAWALKVDHAEESDDSYTEDEIPESDSPASRTPSASSVKPKVSQPPLTPSSRERKQSLPLTAKALVMPSISPGTTLGIIESSDSSMKNVLRELLKTSQELSDLDANDIAQEITRIETKLFLDIKPRHWLHHTLVSSSKDPETDTIARFGQVSNHVAEWVVSLILCHDKPKSRAKQIEKFVDVGVRLRALNNYSALRAVVAGINSATFDGDTPMEVFKVKYPEAWKLYQSWDLLFQAVRSHRAYRMALRNTKGACIPALEVHLLDLIRAHEGNPDYNANDPTKIHWAKYNMIGKFIAGTMQSQEQCLTSGEYNFEERPHIRDLLLKECLMDVQMQHARMASPLQDVESSDRVSLRNASTLTPYPRDAALLRRILFWAS